MENVQNEMEMEWRHEVNLVRHEGMNSGTEINDVRIEVNRTKARLLGITCSMRSSCVEYLCV